MAVAFKLTIWIPVEQVGVVIGRSGQQINRIESACGSRLNVVAEPAASTWAPVHIKGGPEGAFAAARQVEELVEEVDDAVAEFQLGAKARNELRGNAEANVGEDESVWLSPITKRVSAECNVRIRVPPPSEETPEPVTLEGATADVKRALGMVVAVGQGHNPFAPKQPAVDDKSTSSATYLERIVEVPARRLRLVARRGQQQPVYRTISRYSGAVIAKLPKGSVPHQPQDDAKNDDEDETSDETEDEDDEEERDDDDEDALDEEAKQRGGRRRQGVDDDEEPETTSLFFVVKGPEPNVLAAVSALKGIIDGEPVKEAIARLKRVFPTAASRRQHKTDSSKPPPKGNDNKAPQPQTRRRAKRGGRSNSNANNNSSSPAPAPVPAPHKAPTNGKPPPPQSQQAPPHDDKANSSRRRSRGRRKGVEPVPKGGQ